MALKKSLSSQGNSKLLEVRKLMKVTADCRSVWIVENRRVNGARFPRLNVIIVSKQRIDWQIWFLVPDWSKKPLRGLRQFFLRFCGVSNMKILLFEKKTKYSRKTISEVVKTSRWSQLCFQIVFWRNEFSVLSNFRRNSYLQNSQSREDTSDMAEPRKASGKDLHRVSLKCSDGMSLEHVAGSKADKNRRRKSIASQFAHPLTGENVKERQVKKS